MSRWGNPDFPHTESISGPGWMEEANPYSIRDMIDVLMEAADRGMWKPGEGIMEKLKDIYVENEELLEEITDKK